MITTTAIILQLQPHSDRARVLHTYTRMCGRANYIIYGVGGKKKPTGVYAPLSLVELTIREGRASAPSVVEQAQLIYVPENTRFDVKRQTVAIFLAELLSRVLYQPLQDDGLFDYLMTVITELDRTPEPENIHLKAMRGIAARLGFAIDEEQHPFLLSEPATRAMRQEQLRRLCDYYADHVDGWQQLKSLDVLMEIFD